MSMACIRRTAGVRHGSLDDDRTLVPSMPLHEKRNYISALRLSGEQTMGKCIMTTDWSNPSPHSMACT